MSSHSTSTDRRVTRLATAPPETVPVRRVVVLNWKDSAHPSAGGAETYCENVARELVASGVEVTLLCSRPRGSARRESRDGYAIRRMGRTLTVYLWALLWLFKHRDEIDGVIDSQNGFPFFSPLALRSETAVVLLVHHVHQDQFAMYYPAPVARFGRWLEADLTRLVYGTRAVAAVSPSTRTEVRRRLRLHGPIHVIPNGSTPATGIGVRTTDPSIVCVGRLTTHKRWDLVLRAMPDLLRRVDGLTLDIVGAGPERASLEQLAVELELGDAVRFHGFVPTARRDELLGGAWLTVSTSVGEGWGLSIIEAASHGVPAVAFDVPGLRDSVRHGNTGWLTTEADLVSTVAGVIDELADHDRAGAMDVACRAWARSLRWSGTADQFRAVLHAERQPGRQRSRRSARSDLTVVVSLDERAAAAVDPWALRVTDQRTFCDACRHDGGPLLLLLPGCDEVQALEFLGRLGVPEGDGYSVALCRTRDLVSWHGPAVPHVHPVVGRTSDCPNRVGAVASDRVREFDAEAQTA